MEDTVERKIDKNIIKTTCMEKLETLSTPLVILSKKGESAILINKITKIRFIL